jgi:hypothetical protein
MTPRHSDSGGVKTCDSLTVVAHASAVHFELREFLYDGSLHWYRKAELANPAIEYLTPWCAEQEPWYPMRHPRLEVSGMVGFNQRVFRPKGPCPTCVALWDYAIAHRGEFQ